MLRTLLTVGLLGLASAGPGAGEWPAPDSGPDRIEPGSVERIREYTTSPEFLSPEVAYVPEADGIPSPTEVLGHVVGAPGRLTHTADVHGYFDNLAAASPRVKTFEILRTEEGRPVRIAVFGSAENLHRLVEVQNGMRRLADPRRTGPVEARDLARDLPLVYYLNGGLHSPEVGSPEMLMELGHRLVASEKESIRRIRSELIVVVNPVSEPDGRDKMVDWFNRHLKGRTDFDDLPPHSPPYWGKYVFHDNNRDAIQATTAVTEAVLDIYFRFHPVVMLDLHESIPYLYISTGTGPYNDNIDPVTISEWQQMANYEVGRVTAAGMPGAWTWGFFDGWSPNYLTWIANTHNGVGRFYETFGNGSAETMERKLDPDRSRYSGTPTIERTWYRSVPPAREVTWSLRNNTNYMETGVLAALEFAAVHRQELLLNFYRKGERAVRRGREQAPHAWLVPPDQPDPWRVGLLLFTLANQGIEIHRLTESWSGGERLFPAGTHVIRLDQPYSGLAHGLLSPQSFPEDGMRPYDDVSWCLPLHYGVEAVAVAQPGILDAPMEDVNAPGIPFSGVVHGNGPILVMPDLGQEGLFEAVSRLRDTDVALSVSLDPFEIPAPRGGRGAGKSIRCPVGTLILESGDDREGVLENIGQLAESLGLTFYTVRRLPEIERRGVQWRRIGVYESWASTQDSGWVRYTLDRTRAEYEMLHDAELRAGNLRESFDVILIPDTRGDFRDIVHGIDPRHGDLAFTRSDDYPSHGEPFASEQITGGMGLNGLDNLFRFVREGGVLITLGNAGTLVVEGGLVRDLRRVRDSELRTPGSELRARFRRAGHPIAWGYDEIISVFRRDDPLWEVRERSAHHVILQYGTALPGEKSGEDEGEGGDSDGERRDDDGRPREGEGEDPEDESTDLVLAGLLKGRKQIDGKPAVIDVPVGEGRVILFSFNPLHRYLNHSDFRLVYNAMVYAGVVDRTDAADGLEAVAATTNTQ